MLARMWSEKHSLALLIEVETGTNALENRLSVSTRGSDLIPCHILSGKSLPHKIASDILHKAMHNNDLISSVIYNNPKLETTQMSISQIMN